MTLTERVRRRCWHALNPQTANVAGVTIATLQQFVAYQYVMADGQIAALATYFNIKEAA
jgi:hypothetical protein